MYILAALNISAARNRILEALIIHTEQWRAKCMQCITFSLLLTRPVLWNSRSKIINKLNNVSHYMNIWNAHSLKRYMAKLQSENVMKIHIVVLSSLVLTYSNVTEQWSLWMSALDYWKQFRHELGIWYQSPKVDTKCKNYLSLAKTSQTHFIN